MSEQEQNAQDAAPKKGLPIKTVVVVLALLLVEAGAFVALFSMMGKPQETAAAEVEADEHAMDEALVEIQVIKDRFPNSHTGRTWLWETEITVQAKAKHEAHVTSRLESRTAEIRTGLARIWRTAQHNHFNEASLETLTRQATAFLNEVLGKDAEGNSYIERTLISRCVGFPTEF